MRAIGLFALAVLAIPIVAYAALVNINTANAVLLDTLPGIGPSKAAAIVDYRTQHGSFARIEDIQNVSGIGPSTFADIQSFITVGDVSVSSSATDSASSSPTIQSEGDAASPYLPPPPALVIDAGHDMTALLEVPVHFSAQVKAKSGALDPSARIFWNFGDGSITEGSTVEKIYHHIGTYVVTATATDGLAVDRDDLVVRVASAQVHIGITAGLGIIVANDSNERLDLSNWQLTVESSFFRIPSGTILLPESSVLFPYEITHLPMTHDAALWYPDGVVATRSQSPQANEGKTTLSSIDEMQPTAANNGSSLMQTVEPAVTSSISEPAREISTIAAPDESRTAVESSGAALAAAAAAPREPINGFLGSPWTLGLIGVVLLAGGAFVLL